MSPQSGSGSPRDVPHRLMPISLRVLLYAERTMSFSCSSQLILKTPCLLDIMSCFQVLLHLLESREHHQATLHPFPQLCADSPKPSFMATIQNSHSAPQGKKRRKHSAGHTEDLLLFRVSRMRYLPRHGWWTNRNPQASQGVDRQLDGVQSLRPFTATLVLILLACLF